MHPRSRSGAGIPRGVKTQARTRTETNSGAGQMTSTPVSFGGLESGLDTGDHQCGMQVFEQPLGCPPDPTVHAQHADLRLPGHQFPASDLAAERRRIGGSGGLRRGLLGQLVQFVHRHRDRHVGLGPRLGHPRRGPAGDRVDPDIPRHRGVDRRRGGVGQHPRGIGRVGTRPGLVLGRVRALGGERIRSV